MEITQWTLDNPPNYVDNEDLKQGLHVFKFQTTSIDKYEVATFKNGLAVGDIFIFRKNTSDSIKPILISRAVKINGDLHYTNYEIGIEGKINSVSQRSGLWKIRNPKTRMLRRTKYYI